MVFRRLLILLLCFITRSLSAQIHNPEFKNLLDSAYSHTVPLITVEEFKELDKHNVYLLDTREAKEYKVSHLKNARHVGYFWFDMRSVYDIPKDATIVLYCSVGLRSEKIGAKLLRSGYQNVYNLYGSIFEWVNQKNPVYQSNGVQTSEIHGYNKEWSRWLERGAIVLGR